VWWQNVSAGPAMPPKRRVSDLGATQNAVGDALVLGASNIRIRM
jgi:hypothetical protein